LKLKTKKGFPTFGFEAAMAHLIPTMPTVNLISPNYTKFISQRDYATSIKENNIIHFWADRLLHKHKIENKTDLFILIPAENTVTQQIELKIDLFCSEYDEWDHKIIYIEIE